MKSRFSRVTASGERPYIRRENLGVCHSPGYRFSNRNAVRASARERKKRSDVADPFGDLAPAHYVRRFEMMILVSVKDGDNEDEVPWNGDDLKMARRGKKNARYAVDRPQSLPTPAA